MPDPQHVYAADGTRLATYTWGELDAPVVVIVHGFASSARDNWSSPGGCANSHAPVTACWRSTSAGTG
jgi:pimeloyl-ACP methyl ester carboxylesterase